MFSSLTEKFTAVFSRFGSKKKITEQDCNIFVEQLHQALLEADVSHELVVQFVAEVKKELATKPLKAGLSAQEFITKIMYDQVQNFLTVPTQKSLFGAQSILVMGLQGAGKTTTLSKLAYYMQKEARKKNKKVKILLSSVDFYRPAAIDQLELLAKQIQVDFYRAQSEDPIQAAQEIAQYVATHNYDHWLLDTAGRLHVDESMIDEIKKIHAIIQPEYTLLVLDAMTGQESLTVAKAFAQVVPFDGAALAKMDSDTRGGAAFSFSYALKKPIEFVGIGEKPEDMQLFLPDRMASRMLGQGDIMTLAEKAEEKIKVHEQKTLEDAYRTGQFTLQDFENQLAMVNRLGSLGSLMKYMPGMGQMKVPQSAIEQGERELKRFRAIMNSMTVKERVNPKLLDGSRKKRIARGAGVQVQDINLLLSRFEQSKQYVKLFKKSGMFQRKF